MNDMTLAEYRRSRGEPEIPEEHEDAHAEHHPAALEYAQIGGVLAAITAAEVGLYYVDMDHNLLVAILIVMSIAKFALVVLWFMHLKFDNRLFSIFFVGGMALTFSVFAVVIAAQHGQLV
jgi:cytochrome c oxidase subunit 4